MIAGNAGVDTDNEEFGRVIGERAMSKWSCWRTFPDPKSNGYLSAPFGPGVYELRDQKTGELVLYGRGKNVAYRMSSLLPSPLGTGTRKSLEKRKYVLKHLSRIDYRTKACADQDDALAEERKLRVNKDNYRFPT